MDLSAGPAPERAAKLAAKLAAWTEVRVLVPSGWEELVAEIVGAPPATGVAFGRPSLATPEAPAGFDYVRAFVGESDDGPALRERIERELAALPERAGAAELAGLAPEFRAVPPEDWAESWRKRWKPFRLARFAIVLPDDRRPLHTGRPGELRLALEPGGAFGSGRHPTTRACLRALCARLEPGARVLDAGTGSGILSVAAALLGAREALGFDNDQAAQRWAQDLALKNDVQGRCRFLVAGCELLDDPALGRFDVVLANIYSDVIQAEALRFARVLAPGGWFAFSGCPADKADPTRTAIRAAGLVIEQEPVRGRWHSFVGSKAP